MKSIGGYGNPLSRKIAGSLRVFHNSLLSKWFRDTPNDAVSPVGETSWSRCVSYRDRDVPPTGEALGSPRASRRDIPVSIFPALRPSLGASGVPVGETSRSRCNRTAPGAAAVENPFIVGLGPSDATRASERVSLAIVRAIQRSWGTGYEKNVS